jgi:hypothetical protein
MAEPPTCEECGSANPLEHDKTCSQNGGWIQIADGARVRCNGCPNDESCCVKSLGPARRIVAGEVRTTSDTGGQKGVKPQRMSLLPFQALAKISEVYGFGEKKYAAHNWRLGYEWDKSLDALERHIGAFKDGEDNDPESGLSHIAHAGFHILTLLVFILNPRYKRFDNRWATMEERKRNEAAGPTIKLIQPMDTGEVMKGP